MITTKITVRKPTKKMPEHQIEIVHKGVNIGDFGRIQSCEQSSRDSRTADEIISALELEKKSGVRRRHKKDQFLEVDLVAEWLTDSLRMKLRDAQKAGIIDAIKIQSPIGIARINISLAGVDEIQTVLA